MSSRVKRRAWPEPEVLETDCCHSFRLRAVAVEANPQRPGQFTGPRRETNARLKTARSCLFLQLRGELDRSTAPALAEAIRQLSAPGTSPVVLDFTQVSFIDGGGLALLFDLVERCRDQEWVGILSPSANIRRILDTVGLTGRDDPVSVRVLLRSPGIPSA